MSPPNMGPGILIPHPVTFIHPRLDKWQDVVSAELPPPPGEMPERYFALTSDHWVLQTWALLKRRGHDVRISSHYVPEGICVVHYDALTVRDLQFNSYVVAIRADRRPPRICEAVLVQNPAARTGPHEHHVPFWPTPGLIPRDPARGERMERLGFIGYERNLAERFRTLEFRARLADLGVELIVNEDHWNDFRNLDAILGVRSGRPRFLSIKPASKLTNAWLAGCPALLGREPAYETLRQSELDYLVVETVDDVIAAVGKIRESPALYRSIVENGRKRGRDFTVERIAECWEELLAGPIARDYERWRKGPAVFRKPVRFVRFVLRSLIRHLEPDLYQR